ncbi:MAG: L-fucose/L-arabinose isomerase family protein [Verrucomicrobia bacterium]|nr:L-fucose/L-arabinose isomerase family protein [Verrucomicrobiota bacterium]
MKDGKTVFGLIIGNRGFFPDRLAQEGRDEMVKLLADAGYGVVAVGPKDTKFGAIETRREAKICAELFRKHRDEIDGVVVSLPNFGDERGVADTLLMAGLNVPVLMQAYPDEPGKMDIANRRDSLCGKMSACNNLAQYRIPYSLTELHTVSPDSDSFRQDLADFAATCRVVAGLRNARLGAIGARPAAFNTVRYSEKILQLSGISVETIDLSEVLGRVERLKEGEYKDKLDALRKYISCKGIPAESLVKMAKLGVVVDRWVEENDLDGTAFQCWTAIEEYFGVVPCAIMSMMSDALRPSACEVDVAGLVGMLALARAAQSPSMLLDWNNNYGDDPDKAVAFHCSNLPRSVFADVRMSCQDILAGTVGTENAYGTLVGRIKPGPMTFCRVDTDDENGTIRSYVGEGEFTDDPLETFGGYGVVEIPDFQELLAYICDMGFEHHVAATLSEVADPIYEAFDKYLGWDVYYHE